MTALTAVLDAKEVARGGKNYRISRALQRESRLLTVLEEMIPVLLVLCTWPWCDC